MDKIYGWLFTYNPYNETWSAYYRDDSAAYWNGDGSNSKPIYSDKDKDVLLQKLIDGEQG